MYDIYLFVFRVTTNILVADFLESWDLKFNTVRIYGRHEIRKYIKEKQIS